MSHFPLRYIREAIEEDRQEAEDHRRREFVEAIACLRRNLQNGEVAAAQSLETLSRIGAEYHSALSVNRLPGEAVRT